MIARFLFAAIVAPALALFSASDSFSQNVCSAGNATVSPGASFSIDVVVDNTDTLAGMQIPIYYRSEDVDLRCDSVVFENGRCRGFAIAEYKIEPLNKTVYFVLIESEGNPLLPGTGKVASLWFTVGAGSPPGKVELFSGPDAFLPERKIAYNYLFWKPSAKQVQCRYQPGYITVK